MELTTPQGSSKPLWIWLVEKWNYILYVRDHLLAKQDLIGSILDVGCGRRGWFSLLVKSYFDACVTTSDVSSDKVHKARDIARSLGFQSDNYVVADCTLLPFRDKTFDRIIGNAVLHHVLLTIDQVGRELFRVLRTRGKGIFTGEIVASHLVCRLLEKTVLRKAEGEHITTKDGWKKPFLNAGFRKFTISRENRCGYVQSRVKDLFYLVSKYLPSKICTDFLITSCTITFEK